jgi:DNA repair exonuclease SbcCD ATPase subunit
LSAISRQANDLKVENNNLGQRLEEHRQEIDQLVTEHKTEAKELVAETRTQLEALEQRIESTLTEQAEVFRSAQEGRAADFTKSVDGFGTELEAVISRANERADELVEEIRRKDGDARNLLAALGVKGTAGRWAQEAKQERGTANRWRWATVLVVIAAVGVALLASRADSLDDPVFLSRVLISVALGGLATYTAKQSGHHRNREEAARRLELELAAFGPFIEPLPEDLQHAQRGKMVERTFGRRAAATELDGGPSVLSQLARRRDSSPDELAG